MPPKIRSKASGNKKEEEKKEKKTAGGKKTNAKTGSPEVYKWVVRALDMGVMSLREEYRGLAKYTLPDMTINAFNANHKAGRNRYQDVPCQDQCRVALKIPSFPVDYINANYVSTPQGEKRFICTQNSLIAPSTSSG